VKVRVAEPAERQIEKRRAWWLGHRTERELFTEELDAAMRDLRENAATIAVWRHVGGRAVRRVLMSRTRCHLYFELVDDEVVIVAAWGATRGRRPRLAR
jgi:hypothetical protein